MVFLSCPREMCTGGCQEPSDSGALRGTLPPAGFRVSLCVDQMVLPQIWASLSPTSPQGREFSVLGVLCLALPEGPGDLAGWVSCRCLPARAHHTAFASHPSLGKHVVKPEKENVKCSTMNAIFWSKFGFRYCFGQNER